MSSLPVHNRCSKPHLQPGKLDKNPDLVREFARLASNKGCKPGQLGVGWISAQSGKCDMPVIIPIPGTTTEKRALGNTEAMQLSDSDMREIDDTSQACVGARGRYGGTPESPSFVNSKAIDASLQVVEARSLSHRWHIVECLERNALESSSSGFVLDRKVCEPPTPTIPVVSAISHRYRS